VETEPANKALTAEVMGLEMPITSAVSALLAGSVSIEEVIHSLLSRPPKEE
jgi:glycerol-3-phosphate dehydrogenase